MLKNQMAFIHALVVSKVQINLLGAIIFYIAIQNNSCSAHYASQLHTRYKELSLFEFVENYNINFVN